MYTKQNRIIDIIEDNYNLLPIINRFGIYLGNKDKIIESICNELNIDIDLFLLIINTYSDKKSFPEKEMKSFSPLLIIEYLKKTHIYYIQYVFPRLDSLLLQLIDSDKSENKQLLIINQFYIKYKEEFLLHVKEEDELLFPYILKIMEDSELNSNYSIHSFEKEHTNVDEKLNDLKNLIIKYIDPVYDINACNEFLLTLFRFEKDIKDHARIEDKILIPQIVEIENKINGL